MPPKFIESKLRYNQSMDFHDTTMPPKFIESKLRYNQSMDFHDTTFGSSADLVTEVVVEDPKRRFSRRRNRHDD